MLAFVLSLPSPASAQVITTVGDKVGIGTTSPGATLTVETNSAFNQFTLRNDGYYAGGWARGADLQFKKNAGTYHRGLIYGIYGGGDSLTGAYFSAVEDDLSPWSTAQLFLASTGLVGIGTPSPVAKLHVEGDLSLGTTRGRSLLMSYLSLGEVQSSASTILGNNVKVTPGVNSTVQTSTSAIDGSVWMRQNYFHGTTFHRVGAQSVGTQMSEDAGELMRIANTGNVGIGTASPGAKLDVRGALAVRNNYYGVAMVGPLSGAPAYVYINTKIPFSDSPAPQLHITGYNYGDQNRAVKFTLGWYVYQNAFYWTQYKSDLGYFNPARIRLGTYNDNGTTRIRIELSNNSIYWSSFAISAADHNGAASSYDGWTYSEGEMPAGTANIVTVPEHSGIVYATSGNVGIGTTNPTHKLTVNGQVKAKGFLADSSAWADHVFLPDYRLASLGEVEAHIREKGHLPDIPSAAEVAEQGVDLMAMQVKLLQKVEELTLHLIRMEKENADLRRRVRTLETIR